MSNPFSDLNPYEAPPIQIRESASPKPQPQFPLAAVVMTVVALLISVAFAMLGWNLVSHSRGDEIGIALGLLLTVPACVLAFLACLLLARLVLFPVSYVSSRRSSNTALHLAIAGFAASAVVFAVVSVPLGIIAIVLSAATIVCILLYKAAQSLG